MIKVLRIFNRFIIGGPSYNVFYLTKYLGEGFETKLITGTKDEGEEDADFLLDKLPASPLNIPSMGRSIHPWKDYQSYKVLKNIIREYQPDIVHTHGAKPGTIGRLAAIHENVPVILHTFHGHVFHSYFNKIQTTAFIEIERYLAKKTTAIIAISEKQKCEFVKEYKICAEEKVHTVPLGFDLDKFVDEKGNKRRKFRSEFSLADDTLAIGIIGRLAPVKNHHMFVHGMAYLKKAGKKNIKGFIVGDGKLKDELNQYAVHQGLTTSDGNGDIQSADIIFTSWRKDIDCVTNGLDIISLTSLNEGTPVSLIEAQAAGKTVIATNVGGLTDCLAPVNLRNVVKVNEYDQYGNKLLSLCDNFNYYFSQSESIRQHVIDKYSYHRLVSDVQSLYRNLTGPHIRTRVLQPATI